MSVGEVVSAGWGVIMLVVVTTQVVMGASISPRVAQADAMAG